MKSSFHILSKICYRKKDQYTWFKFLIVYIVVFDVETALETPKCAILGQLKSGKKSCRPPTLEGYKLGGSGILQKPKCVLCTCACV